MMHDCKYDDLPTIDQVKHPVRKLAQQCTPGTRTGVNDDLRSWMRLDASERDFHGEQKLLTRTNAPLPIPRRDLGNICPSFRRKDYPRRHNPSCLRIAASATAHDTPAPGFCR